MKTVILVLIAASSVFAQSGAGNLQYTTPALIPAVNSAALTATATIYGISLTNETDADVTCVIKTKQSTPRTIFAGPVLAGTLYPIAWPFGYQSPGGVSWYCTSGSAVSAQIAYRQ